jgi:hypothetical protein
MKTTPQIAPSPLPDSGRITAAIADTTAVTDFSYQQSRGEKRQVVAAAGTLVAPKKFPELTTFRALSRQVFGIEAGRENIMEAVVFGWIMLVAAWPLSVTLNQLGTMMISPPNALWEML